MNCPLLRTFNLLIAVMAPVSHLWADSGTWIANDGDGAWSTSGNWAGGLVADGAGFTADFGALNITVHSTIRLNSPRTIGHLHFGDVEPDSNWILNDNGDAENVLTLADSMVTPSITVSNQTATISTRLIGPQAIRKLGAGYLRLTENNSYTGGTFLNDGVLGINSDSNLGHPGSSIQIDSATLRTLGSMTISRPVALVSPNSTIDVVPGATTIIASGIGGGGRLNKIGFGTLELSGSNSYSGGTVVASGILNLKSPTALPTTDGVTVGAGAELLLGQQGAGVLYSVPTQTLALGGGTLKFGNTTPGASTLWAGNVLLMTNSTISSMGIANVLGEIGGVVAGPGQLHINGPIKLSNANIVTGDTRIISGGLILGHTQALQNSTLNMLGSDSGNLSFGSLTSATLGGLTGSRNIDLTNNGSGAVALSVGNNNSSFEYSGQISGPGSLTKIGTGTFTLTGGNVYTGHTTINQGTLQIGNGGSTGYLGNTSVSIASGAALSFNRGDAVTFAGQISGGGQVVKYGSGILLLTGTNSHSGGTTISAGTLAVNNAAALGSGPLVINGGILRTDAALAYTGQVTTGALGGTIHTNGSNSTFTSITGAGSLNKIGTGTLILSGGNTYTGLTTIDQGILQIGNGGNTGTIANGFINNNAALAFNHGAGVEYIYSGGINGTGTLTKNGPSTLVLAGGNSYTGSTVINQGTLQIGNGGNTGYIADGFITNNSSLVFNHGSAISYVYAGGVSGSGTLTKNGLGTLILAGGNVYTGLTTVNQGTLQIGNGGNTGYISDESNIVNNAALVFNRSNEYSYAGDISGTGTVTKNGVGAVSLSGNLSHTGGTTINGGRLNVDGSIQGLVTVNAGGTLGGTGTIGGNVTNFGRVAPGNSPGILTIDGDYTQSGASVLEIEVQGYTPGTEHDQLQVGGTANLAGRLEVPILQPFNPPGGPFPPPVPGQKIEFLVADEINGEFFPIVSPNLTTLYPNLAMEVDFISSGNQEIARLGFVPQKVDIEFDDTSNDGTPEWNEEDSWRPAGSDLKPTYQHDLTILNNSMSDQTLDVTSGDYQVAELTVGGGLSNITLMIGDGDPMNENDNLASQSSISVENNGVLALNESFIAGSNLAVLNGGLVKGNGLVDLSPESVEDKGTFTVSNGTIAPGFSVGHLDIDGNLTLGNSGELIIEATSMSDRDTIAVSGEVVLEGSLTLDVTGNTLQPGDSIQFLTAESITEDLSSFEVIGNDNDLYFRLRTEDIGGGLLALSTDGLHMGDFNCDGGDPTTDDIPAFALALTNPRAYDNEFGASAASRSLDGDQDLDVDDIDDFAEMLGMTLSEIIARMRDVPNVPEPHTAALMVTSLWMVLSLRGGNKIARGKKRARLPVS